ncbi:MAG: 2-octaprenyl-6-methoxyphenyl hydroxylase [Candidatus Arsenophonus melophagi]|nr:2-octaprenyl-6-methoxyphenyl hydroxylase [Candidatus Arsenophonus melophagi]
MKVIVVGGGMAGASLTLAISAFSHGKVRVSLIEANSPNEEYHDYDPRTIVLAYSTCCQFQKLGIWSGLKKYVTPITYIHVSEYGYASTVNMYAKDYFLPAFGYVVELHKVKNYLFEQLHNAINIELHCPNEVLSVENTMDQVSVTLTTGKVLTGQLLVAADGCNSMIGKANQVEWHRYAYQQCAIIANVLTSEAPDGRAFERFTQNGPLAILPISRCRSSLVWCHPLEMEQHIMQWSNCQFMEELQKWFGWRLGEIKDVSERYSFPLLLSQAKKVISHRLVLIGNAAQTLHPIAGQGFNLAMRDIINLAHILSEVGNHANDIGSYSVLKQYQMQRNHDRWHTIKFTDNLVHLFSNNHLLFAIARNIGLMAMEALPMIRDKLARLAMGDCIISHYLEEKHQYGSI